MKFHSINCKARQGWRMKVITLKNEYGETIELKRGTRGEIRMRHSDVDEKVWGRFVNYADYARELGVPGGLAGIVKAVAEKVGVSDTDRDAMGALMASHAVMVLRRRSWILNGEEIAMIRKAILEL